MRLTIWKYAVPIEDAFTLIMPEDATVLCVQLQGGKPHIWVLVNPNSPPKTWSFRLFGTGHPIESWPGSYVGTFQVAGGALIFHLFEVDE